MGGERSADFVTSFASTSDELGAAEVGSSVLSHHDIVHRFSSSLSCHRVGGEFGSGADILRFSR
ncbi:hypothetical protein RMSM_03208 [Rhodopirellula maiorica SM1]|uniref:Uncharacterized protein n=1 Tax=Rhodopirellula maiorica SM1 TaxID=1265738 RepID=M5RL12_9BACT|nr:hypothetical protein RMSM_03208 [Rhodopirellula maiorica SM1]